jgi:penicillin-binding protein 1C
MGTPALKLHAAWCANLASAAIVLLVVSLLLPVGPDNPAHNAVTTVRVTDRAGNPLRVLGSNGRSLPVNIDSVAPTAIEALIATEDRNFRRHHGIDTRALIGAAFENARALRVVRGGSTITMQVARTLRGKRGRTLWNKLAEMHLALRLDSRLTKDEVLTLWLNRVEFGNALRGIEAASEFYFGKSAIDLTDAEATFLVGLPQSPTRYNPLKHIASARSRHRRVLDAAVATGVLSPDEREAILSTPPDPTAHRGRFRSPHLVDRLAAEYVADLSSLSEIRTTIDPWVQGRVEQLAITHAATVQYHGVTGIAAVVLDNDTGDVLAYLGSADYFDDAGLGQNDGVSMLRQPGSALKPFVYAAALSTGRYTTSTILPDLPVQIVEAGAAFSPANYDQEFHGPVPLRVALASSYNVPAIRIAQELGPFEILQALRHVGFASLGRTPEHYGVGLALGNGEVQLIELATAYSALSRGGVLPHVGHMQWVRTHSGDTLRAAPRSHRQTVVTPQIAYLITDILSDPEARAPAFGRGGPLELPFPLAVKTGTSKDYRDNYAVGYTSEHTVAVWAGNFDGSPMKQVSGVSGAAPLLKSIFLELGPGGEPERPAGIESAEICPVSGARPGAACPTRAARWFLRGTTPTHTCAVHRAIANDRGETHVYTMYESRYHEWMRANGIPFPPTERLEAVHPEAPGDEIAVVYPSDGTTYVVDPVLRAEFQRIRLRAVAPEGSTPARWIVDDDTLGSDFWTLARGRHKVVAVAVGIDGTTLRSSPHVVNVLDHVNTDR